MNFIAATEGQLPASYYAFNRAAIDFPAALQTAEKLLKRTLDMRLLALMAKLSILNRDVAGFAQRLGNVAWLVREHWEAANPKAEGDDYSGRIAQLATLEDNAVVLLPLQYAPLIETNREGALSYRDQLLATGAAQPRSATLYDLRGAEADDGAGKVHAGEVDRASLERRRDRKAGRRRRDADKPRRFDPVDQGGHDRTCRLRERGRTAEARHACRRDDGVPARRAREARPVPRAAARGAAARARARLASAAAAAPAAFASRAEVDAALASAFGYFAASEPTSPALLLIGQARETLGKNLYEVMKLLAPPHADAARVFVGPDGVFTVPVKSLSNAPSAAIESAPAEPAATRAAAIALIDAVAAHMQKAEPSSPVPYLLDRARNLATRDFVSLLQDLLSDEAIAALKKGK